RAFYEAIRARLERAPGVEAASVGRILPLSGSRVGFTFGIEGQPTPPGAVAPQTEFTQVGPRFFETLGLSIRRGRALGEDDRAGAPYVAVISETFARRYFSGVDPIGKRVRPEVADKPWVTIVGVVADVRSEALDQEPGPMLYLSLVQAPEAGI